MRTHTTVGVAACFCAGLALTPSAHAGILDQSNGSGAGASGSTVSESITQMQGVTAGLAGQLERIEFFAIGNEPFSGNLEVFVKAGLAPASEPWDFSVIIDASTLANMDWFGIDVTAAGMSFNVGETYTIGLAMTGPGSVLVAGTGATNSYAGGVQWSDPSAGPAYTPAGGDSDLVFRTYIVPAPGALALLAPAALCARRRRG